MWYGRPVQTSPRSRRPALAKPCATNLDLYLTTFPSASVFTLKTHVPPTAFLPSDRDVSIQSLRLDVLDLQLHR
jgi:hypothetical protein